MLLGLRVMRGPDWGDGDTDGGEGHLGTVIQLLGNHTVRVLWDMGEENTCSTGADGKFDLRVFDTAQIGKYVSFSRTELMNREWSCPISPFILTVSCALHRMIDTLFG